MRRTLRVLVLIKSSHGWRLPGADATYLLLSCDMIEGSPHLVTLVTLVSEAHSPGVKVPTRVPHSRFANAATEAPASLEDLGRGRCRALYFSRQIGTARSSLRIS